MSYPDTSASERMLYSHQKALDDVLELGALPERLFRIFYPIWRVKVEGTQRIQTDFNELEWFIERGISEGGYSSIQELAFFFGLDFQFVNHLVDFLRTIGHIVGDDDRLTLTELGLASVKARIRFEEKKTGFQLYFDGLGNHPLSRDHYKIPIIEELPEFTPFDAFYSFDHHWKDNPITRLMSHPERGKFNLPDEVTKANLLDREIAYLPVYIIQLKPEPPEGVPPFVVFSRVKGRRDTTLENPINNEVIAQTALRKFGEEDIQKTTEKYLRRYDLGSQNWYLQPDGPNGIQVTIDDRARYNDLKFAQNGEGEASGILRVETFILVNNWCVWITCDDPEIRRDAVIKQMLDWLQGVIIQPEAAEIQKHLATLCDRSRVELVPIEEIIIAAEQIGLARAIERLEKVSSDSALKAG